MSYTYTFLSPAPNYPLLESEIKQSMASMASHLESISHDGTNVSVSWAVELNATQQLNLSNIITGHDPEPLDSLKTKLSAQATDYYSKQLANGFAMAGSVFSESAQAQAQWVAIKSGAVTISFPYHLPTLSGIKHEVADATALNAIVDGVLADVKAKTEAWRDAVNDIVLAGTKESAQAVYDGYAV